MGNFSTMLLILVFLVIAITLFILLLAVLRESLFWYWRSKGVLNEPKDILSQNHETALIIRKSIAGLKAAEAASKKAASKPSPSLGKDVPG
jgi:hypothetical protein